MRDIDIYLNAMSSYYDEKTKELIKNISTDELEFMMNRYCGPSNKILSEKYFGFPISKKIVKEELDNRYLEKFLLDSDN